MHHVTLLHRDIIHEQAQDTNARTIKKVKTSYFYSPNRREYVASSNKANFDIYLDRNANISLYYNHLTPDYPSTSLHTIFTINFPFFLFGIKQFSEEND